MKQTFDDLVETLAKGTFYLGEAVELLEKTYIAYTLASTGGNCSAASKLLGIHRNTLKKKMRAYKLDTPRPARKPPQKVKRTARRVKSAS
jgi:Response regulator containing CheY-like receiver, AAA-type ATPase, and DNA-binding domains